MIGERGGRGDGERERKKNSFDKLHSNYIFINNISITTAAAAVADAPLGDNYARKDHHSSFS